MMTRKYILLFLLLIVSIPNLYSQTGKSTFLIKFTDKNNSPYGIQNPEAFLSPRAIERRQRQGITIREDDLPVNPEYLDTLRSLGADILVTSHWLNLVIIEISENVSIDVISQLACVREVVDAGYMRKGINVFVSGEPDLNIKPFFSCESFLKLPGKKILKLNNIADSFDYGASWNQINMINGIPLHNMGFTGAGKIIAVLDAGFWRVDMLPVFDTLWAHDCILGARNFVEHGGNVYDTTINQHGMMVLSVMGGNLPGEIVGTAPGASYYLIRTEDATAEYLLEEYYWIEGAEFADSVGADIINSSLGYTTFDNPLANHTYEDMDGQTCPVTLGADLAVGKGLIVCNSAGNYANGLWLYVGAPADGDSVLSIGAVDGSGNWASFSSIGPTYDGRIKPDIVAVGSGTVIASPSGGIWYGSGTSFSSPIIAGMTACLWQSNPAFNNMDIIHAIQTNSSRYSNPDYYFGYGIPDYADVNNFLEISDKYKLEDLFNISVTPNPFTQSFFIRFYLTLPDQIIIEIFEVSGRQLFKKSLVAHSGLNIESINNLGALKRGFYYLKVRSKENVQTVRILKF
jgi:hypothetical protein